MSIAITAVRLTNRRTISMSLAQTLFAEFEAQAPITRRFLERLPEDKLPWKPHDRSMTAGQLALHIAGVPGGVIRLVQHSPVQVPDFNNMQQPSGLQHILDTLDNSVIAVGSILSQLDDVALQATCRLMRGDQEVLAMPRVWFVRDIMLNHWYQHRGQFSVYLRMLNVPVPASWGPSADEQPGYLQRGRAA
jgi:uncharacterized damage-inducible protein DinB